MKNAPQTTAKWRLIRTAALAACMTGAGWFGAALAQTSPGIDLATIRAQTAAQAEEAQALAHVARDRAEHLRPEARAETDGAIQRARSYTATTRGKTRPHDGTFDFDAMVATAGHAALSAMGTGPRFIAFASTSMPASALRQMITDVPRAGGVVVFRGLREGSARAMTAALTGVFQPGEHVAGIGIDPRLFRAFHVEAVPTYVMAGSDFDLCDGLDCSTAVPPFDVMTGNVTAAYALETFSRGGGPGARLAAQHLARLERPAP